MAGHDLRKLHGFTLLEMLTVMLLIAVFFVLSISAFRNHDSARHIAVGDVLASHIRYAQMRSMGSRASWGIVYDETAGNGYRMFRDDCEDCPRLLPGEPDVTVDLGTGIRISPAHFSLRFDERGRPHVNASPLLEGALTLTLGMDGQPDRNLVVIANTGYVQWKP